MIPADVADRASLNQLLVDAAAGAPTRSLGPRRWDQGMPSEENATIVSAQEIQVVHSFLELHEKRLEDQLMTNAGCSDGSSFC